MSSYTILVGTMTGTAQMAAEAAEAALKEGGEDVSLRPMDEVGVEIFAPGHGVLIVSSTFGAGDVPDNAAPLFDALEARRPDLSDMPFAVFALGDSIYPQTYCFGGRRFDDLLGALGARRLAEVRLHNASSGEDPEQACAEWARGFVGLELEHAA